MKIGKFVTGTVVTMCVTANLAAITAEAVVVVAAIKAAKKLINECKEDQEPQTLVPTSIEENVIVYRKPSKFHKAISIIREVLR